MKVGRLSKNWHYNDGAVIGEGGYGRVFACREKKTGPFTGALKIFSRRSSINTYLRELGNLETISGAPYSVQLLDHGLDSKNRLCIVTSFIEGESLNQYVLKKGCLDEAQVDRLLECLLSALEFVHAKGLVHLDIGAPNIMLAGDDFYLLDWGVSRKVGPESLEELKANPEVIAPECYFGRLGPEADFYSLGWILVYALSGALPYNMRDEKDKFYRAIAHCKQRPEFDESIPEKYIPLICSLLSKNPDERCRAYSIEQLFELASGAEEDFLNCKTLEQINYEYSYIERGAHYGIPYVQYEWARQLLDEKRQAEAVYWLKAGIDNGYAKSAGRYAAILEKRDNDEQEEQYLRELLDFAVAKGDNRARYILARGILDGRYRGDESEAYELFRAAADSGMASAQFRIARHLLEEVGDKAMGHHYLERSVALDWSRAVKYQKKHYPKHVIKVEAD